MSFPMIPCHPNDIRYLNVDTVVRGKGRDRLKYLDFEGRWVLSGRSIPYISATFNHLEKLNYARGGLFDTTEPALNAIGMIGWTPEKKVVKKPVVIQKPPAVEVVEEVPPSPRELVPHRSAGYGPAHQKRKLSVPDRSRSPSLSSRTGSPVPEFDKYATKYHRKDSITSYGTKWGPDRNREDPGYGSAVSSGAPSPNPSNQEMGDRYPHRTQAISPLPGHRLHFDTEYDSSYLKRASPNGSNDIMEIKARADQARYRPRYYNSEYSTASEQYSPNKRNQSAEEYLLESYHSKTVRGPGSRYQSATNF